jgi:hypothetical protein
MISERPLHCCPGWWPSRFWDMPHRLSCFAAAILVATVALVAGVRPTGRSWASLGLTGGCTGGAGGPKDRVSKAVVIWGYRREVAPRPDPQSRRPSVGVSSKALCTGQGSAEHRSGKSHGSPTADEKTYGRCTTPCSSLTRTTSTVFPSVSIQVGLRAAESSPTPACWSELFWSASRGAMGRLIRASMGRKAIVSLGPDEQT